MITASIVTYKTSRDELTTVLNCILNSIIDTVYIVDNSPTNELENFVKAFSSKIVYISNPSNTGYGAAHNIALKKSIETDTCYHIVLNPDIYFETGTIEMLTNYMDTNEEVGHVMPKIIYPNGELQYLCKLIPTPSDLFIRRFFPEKWKEKLMNNFQLKFTGYDKIMNVPYLSGCFMFLRIDALKKTGLFDERFFMYPEDIDLTRRIHKEYRTVFYPDVTVVHVHGADSYKSLKMLKIHIFNMIKYFNKWGWFFDTDRKKINKKILKEHGTSNNRSIV